MLRFLKVGVGRLCFDSRMGWRMRFDFAFWVWTMGGVFSVLIWVLGMDFGSFVGIRADLFCESWGFCLFLWSVHPKFWRFRYNVWACMRFLAYDIQDFHWIGKALFYDKFNLQVIEFHFISYFMQLSMYLESVCLDEEKTVYHSNL